MTTTTYTVFITVELPDGIEPGEGVKYLRVDSIGVVDVLSTVVKEETGEFCYKCNGPFTYGTDNAVCVHGWNAPHMLSSKEAQHSDHLTNCGLLPTRQRIEKIEE